MPEIKRLAAIVDMGEACVERGGRVEGRKRELKTLSLASRPVLTVGLRDQNPAAAAASPAP